MALCDYHSDSLGWDACSEGQEEQCDVYLATINARQTGVDPSFSHAQALLNHYRATMTIEQARQRITDNIMVGRSGWADPQLLAALEKVNAAAGERATIIDEIGKRLLQQGMGEALNPFDVEAILAEMKEKLAVD